MLSSAQKVQQVHSHAAHTPDRLATVRGLLLPLHPHKVALQHSCYALRAIVESCIVQAALPFLAHKDCCAAASQEQLHNTEVPVTHINMLLALTELQSMIHRGTLQFLSIRWPAQISCPIEVDRDHLM